MRTGQDLRYSLRSLRSRPGFTAAVVLTLALGIGANVAIFSVIYAVLLKPLPYPDATRIVILWHNNVRKGIPKWTVPYPDFLYWRDHATSFEQMAAFRPDYSILTGDSQPEHVPTAAVSSNFFSLLGIKPEVGREIRPDEDRPNGARVALISHGLWQRHYRSDPHILGRTMLLDGQGYTIVGVVPPGFRFLRDADAWISLGYLSDQRWLLHRLSHPLIVFARLKAAASPEQAQAEMNIIASTLAQLYPDTSKGYLVNLVPLRDELVGDVRPAILLLSGGVFLVLVITCANIANLLLSRALGRQKELALRTALGAERKHLVLQLLTESLVMGLLGGAAGILVGLAGIKLLVAMAPAGIPNVRQITLNLPILAFAFVLSFLCGLVCGVFPALSISGFDLNSILKNESHTSAGGGSRGVRLRQALVVSEIALTSMLLISTGLMLRSFVRVQQTDAGFLPQRRLVMKLDMPDPPITTANDLDLFISRLMEKIHTLPGVVAAGAVSALPLTGETNLTTILPEGATEVESAQSPAVEARSVSPGYFKAMGMVVLQGRDFSDADNSHSSPVTVINQSMARRFWPGESAIGRHVTIVAHRQVREVVGIVKDVRNVRLDADPVPEMFATYGTQVGPPFAWLVVHTVGDPLDMVQAVRARVGEVQKLVPLYEAGTMETYFAESMGRRRFNLVLLVVFSVSAVILASVGLYGVVSYGVNQRIQEIGIRVALGSTQSDVLRLILMGGLSSTVLGIGIGLTLALVTSHLISSLVFGISSFDFITYFGTCVLLGGVALLASYLPARRATRVDPVTALRATQQS